MRKISGTVQQLVADVTEREVRSTGVDPSKFEAVIVRKINLGLDPTQIVAWAAASAIDIAVSGNADHTHVQKTVVYKAASAVQGFYEVVPVEAKVYDDEFYIDLGSIGTGVANNMVYEIFYDIVPGNEMEKVQSGY